MLSFFKRKAPAPPTFKTRVGKFWQWYTGNSQRFLDTIEAKRCPDLQPEVSAKVDEWLPGFAWVFGPGENGEGHSFTLSGEGNPHKQLLTLFWREQAPALPGWTFYSARQASDSVDDRYITIGQEKFNPLEFWFAPQVNHEREAIDLTVWHPRFATMEPRLRWTILYIYLDEVLGEIGTQSWIGKIEFGDQQLADSIPLKELPVFIAKVTEETGWQMKVPGELVTAYRKQNPERGSLREDILVGTTCQMALVQECRDGLLDPDPLEPFGADYMFLAFDVGTLRKGEESYHRGEVEDALQTALAAAGQGRRLGGALGMQYAYIDLLLFDGAESIETVKRVVREQRLPAGTTLEYFAKARRRERIRL